MDSYIYSIISKEYLHEIMTTFHSCINIPIQLIDEKGTILDSCGSITNFCNIFKKLIPDTDSCVKLHVNASHRAIGLGETYIFSCHANLNHIVFPLTNKKSFIGSVLAGPFLMDTPDSTLISDISKRYHFTTEELFELYDELSSIEIFAPAKVNDISKLLYFLFSNLVSDNATQLKINQEMLHQQSKISESIQMYKNSGLLITSSYPYEKEKELITKVKTGDIQSAKGILNDLLGYVLFSAGSSLDIVKVRSMELSSLLSRAAIEGGASSDIILKLNNRFLKNIPSIENMDTLCFELQDTVTTFIESMFNYVPTKNNEIVKHAIQYISINYSTALTLEEVAEHVHLNPAYFSSVFKQSAGSSYKEYLNMVRIEESKRLLSNTDYPILDIAIATGFADQGYFSKVFKKLTGLTPKQYRN